MKNITPFLSLTLCLFTLAMAQDDKKDAIAAVPVVKQEPVLLTDQITIPNLISYQGKLTDNSSNPVPDSAYSITFRLYTTPTGGTPFWSETQSYVSTHSGLFNCLLGEITPIPYVPEAGNLYFEMQVSPYAPMSPRIRLVSAPYAYLARKADSANYATNAQPTGPAGGDLSGTYPNPVIANNAVTSAKIQDGTILRADVVANFKAPYADTADYARAAPAVDSARVAANSHKLQGKDTTALDARYVNENQANAITSAMIQDGAVGTADIANIAVTSAKIGNGEVTMDKINQSGAIIGQVIKWNGSNWAPANDSVGQGDNAWVRGTPDSVLYTIRQLGIARGGADNMLYGTYRHTHTNLGGYACTTGTSGQNYRYCTVGGGSSNAASGYYATVGGGYNNSATGYAATVAGGYRNTASGNYATVAGGGADTSAGNFSFTAGNLSVVPSSYSNSAAFNGQTATASNQTRVGALSKASGTFTIDHPLDPYNKILNHYFIEGPEMLNIYRGSVVLDATGRAEVKLPDYFEALNRNPHIQLTGVGTSDVYVAEKISGNRFVIGGKPNTEVYWQVTGERKDVSAEVTRRMMPVEHPKTGALAGRMLDDEFLCGCMEQLEREGKASGIDFRTAGGRQRYERMKRMLQEKPEEIRR